MTGTQVKLALGCLRFHICGLLLRSFSPHQASFCCIKQGKSLPNATKVAIRYGWRMTAR